MEAIGIDEINELEVSYQANAILGSSWNGAITVSGILWKDGRHPRRHISEMQILLTSTEYSKRLCAQKPGPLEKEGGRVLKLMMNLKIYACRVESA